MGKNLFAGSVHALFDPLNDQVQNILILIFLNPAEFFCLLTQNPTPVQRKALPIALSGVDTVVMARTGSGKTCAFLIPVIEKLLANAEHGNNAGTKTNEGVQAVILSPTRELSVQTLKVLQKLASDTPLRSIGIHGGEGMEKQFDLLSSKPHIICATPGRLAHHLTEIPDFTLSACMVMVLDEADRLFEMGFALQIRQIAKSVPNESCQKLLFSATMPKVLVEFTKSGFCVDPTVVRLDQEATVSEELRIAFLTCRSADKDAVLLHILQQIEMDQQAHKDHRTGLTLIFAATRHHVEYIMTLLTASGSNATMIYGTLDQEARKQNLSAFRSGKKPILVVTDVAARGIDVPLIDHVIHYHFPPSPKLFVHRSGRAARAGRIGFCWALVEPDELAYMMELHLFLGRRPSTGLGDDDAHGHDDDGKRSAVTETMYTLDEMRPDMVHYGSVPESVLTQEVENVQRIMNSELSGSLDAESLRALTKVCKNAMKQYRKTRVEASKDGVRRAKAILEGERLETGQRVGGGAIPPHPLLRGIERKKQKESNGLGDLENSLKREEFLRAMANFRPKETVFEAFATGGGKDVGIVSHVDKGRTTANKKHETSSAALAAMKNMRRQMRMARDKGSSLVVAGSSIALADASDNRGCDSLAYVGQHDSVESSAIPNVDVNHDKRRVTKAERRRLKKHPGAATPASNMLSTHEKPTKTKRGADFRDPAFFIDSLSMSNTEEAHRSRQIEAVMQPSAAASLKGTVGTALRLEETMLDLVGDEREDLISKQRMMRWDKSKRNYVQTTVGQELSGDSKSKRMKLESGQLVKHDKLKLGEVYAKWQKKTNRSIGRTGVFDDADDGPSPMSQGASKRKSQPSPGREKMKTSAAIKKERAEKQNLAMKNMKKSARRSVERKQREEKSRAIPQSRPQGKSRNAKKGR